MNAKWSALVAMPPPKQQAWFILKGGVIQNVISTTTV